VCCVAARCSASQYVVVCCSVLQCAETASYESSPPRISMSLSGVGVLCVGVLGVGVLCVGVCGCVVCVWQSMCWCS